MRTRTLFAAMAVWTGLVLLPASATTLEQMSMQQMIDQSTAIVRGKVLGTFSASRNGSIYTYYHVQVLENLKAQSASTVDVAVPGGALGGMQQSVAGAPELKAGAEYVLFLWTSKSGLTQIIGLSQGAFDVRTNTAGDSVLMRPPITDPMLDAQGHLVGDAGLTVKLNEVRTQTHRGSGH